MSAEKKNESDCTPLPVDNVLRFYHDAMATQFEIFIASDDRSQAEGAAMAAFEMIDRAERFLSSYQEGSDVWIVNNEAGQTPLRADLLTLRCLAAAERLSRETGGAFDITVGPLIQCYRDAGAQSRKPTEKEIKAALAMTGVDQMELSRQNFSIRLRSKGARIDMGAIGKGFALDLAADTLRGVWEMDRVMINSGGSTVLALGGPAPGQGWKVGVGSLDGRRSGQVVELENMALSASGTFFQGEHIYDPRTGYPAQGGPKRTWAFCPKATDADALSTAFMVMKPSESREVCKKRGDVAGVLLVEKSPNATPKADAPDQPEKEYELTAIGSETILRRIGLGELL